MTTPFVVGQVVQLRFWCVDSEQASVNTNWYVVAAVGGSAATDDDLALEADVDGIIVYPPILNNGAFYRGTQVSIHTGVPPYSAITAPVFSVTSPTAGNAGAVALPRQTCGLCRLTTALPGPKNRGRCYAPFPAADSDSGDGVPSAGYLADLITWSFVMGAGRAIAEGGRTATLVRVIIHRPDKHGLVAVPTPVSEHPTLAFWATQRRRGSFGRANKSPI